MGQLFSAPKAPDPPPAPPPPPSAPVREDPRSLKVLTETLMQRGKSSRQDDKLTKGDAQLGKPGAGATLTTQPAPTPGSKPTSVLG